MNPDAGFGNNDQDNSWRLSSMPDAPQSYSIAYQVVSKGQSEFGLTTLHSYFPSPVINKVSSSVREDMSVSFLYQNMFSKPVKEPMVYNTAKATVSPAHGSPIASK